MIELKWARIGISNENQNILFTFIVEIKIKMNYITVDVFILF